MQSVLSAELAVLVHLKPVRIVLLVLHGVVISLLAFLTSKCDLNSHSRSTSVFVIYLDQETRIFFDTQKKKNLFIFGYIVTHPTPACQVFFCEKTHNFIYLLIFNINKSAAARKYGSRFVYLVIWSCSIKAFCNTFEKLMFAFSAS